MAIHIHVHDRKTKDAPQQQLDKIEASWYAIREKTLQSSNAMGRLHDEYIGMHSDPQYKKRYAMMLAASKGLYDVLKIFDKRW